MKIRSIAVLLAVAGLPTGATAAWSQSNSQADEALTKSAPPMDGEFIRVTEKITTGTSAGAKHYQANISGTCQPGDCRMQFGKKARVRHITLVTCAVTTDGDPQLASVYFGQPSDVQFYIPVASVAPQGPDKIGVFTLQYEFDIPADVKAGVITQSSGNPYAGTCTMTGFLK